MKFDKAIKSRYRKSIDEAFATILAQGTEAHRAMLNDLIASEMLIRVRPVSEINASGLTGLISAIHTNARLLTERLTLRDALGEIHISIAEETIDTGGQRGCEGTLVHEGKHAHDFALALESFSNSDMNPIGIFDPSLYELEWNAHKAAGDYMIARGTQEFLNEGIELMILGLGANGSCFVNDDGIRRRLSESYGLSLDGNQGALASEMMGIRV